MPDERDPRNRRRRRLARATRGSALRPNFGDDGEFGGSYRSLVAIGGTAAATSVADTASTAALAATTAEAGHINKLIVSAGVTGAAATLELGGIYVTSILHNNDQMVTGKVPAALFRHDSVDNPMFGHWVEVNDVISVTFENQSGATAEIGFCFTV